MNKLVELYKESSEEWSLKAGELEGAIKALEVKCSLPDCCFLGTGLWCVSPFVLILSLFFFFSFCYPNQTQLSQVENDYKERLEKEVGARNQFEKVCSLN